MNTEGKKDSGEAGLNFLDEMRTVIRKTNAEIEMAEEWGV